LCFKIDEVLSKGLKRMTTQTFTESYVKESLEILSAVDVQMIEAAVQQLSRVRERGGRLFILGVGGSAGHASHAVNDFRKLCNFEAYSPTDNVSELTARTNDDGWDTTFEDWLRCSRLSEEDGVLVFSVGGGNEEKRVSVNIVRALRLAKERDASIFGIVGRDGGYVSKVADVAVIVPPLFPERITPHTEGLCAVIWHLLVSHPSLAIKSAKWESI
jgi:D-sedoheptulose 7-phosphate isomerase